MAKATSVPTTHPLATELCLLKERLTRAGLYATAHKMESAVRAIGWELVARAPAPKKPGWVKTASDARRHRADVAKNRRLAWIELEKA